ncbi:acyl-CoA synthetase family member 4 [Cimex lectularius]|uniref:Uncharacterized protein n=1 Tax=Cimex lectularius TaxID=79782 RepID=A0A8I6TK70_CIMLE|nr:acyl-CoA synthetase family member 4 [Cimex lectularius]
MSKLMTLHELFMVSSSKYPENNCILFDDGEGKQILTYSGVKKEADRLQLEIRQRIGNEKCFLILCLECTKSTPIIILSSLILSCPFYFSYPKDLRFEELNDIVHKLKAGWVLTNVNYMEQETADWIEHKSFNVLGETIYLWKTGCYKCLHHPFAYAIRTSGSLGCPKLVKVPHDAIVPNVTHLRELLNISENDVVLLNSPLTFDPSIVEIFLAFSSGAALCLVPYHVKNNKTKFYKTIEECNVTVIQTTPSLFRKYLKEYNGFFSEDSSLKSLILGGEEFPTWKDVKTWGLKKDNKINVFNIYGITEVSCWASCKRVWPSSEEPPERIDIGDPLSETRLTIERIEVGEKNVGELMIDSSRRICTIDGENYEDLLARKPVFRRSGDLFEEINGKLYFVSRKDDSSFKRYGIKVNTTLIEVVCKDYPNDGCHAVWTVINSDLILGLFIKIDTELSHFKSWLTARRAKFPKGHWPDLILKLDEIPLSKHGKVDTSFLKERVKERYKNLKIAKFEGKFRKLWKHFTGSSSVENGSIFITSGGDSIKAIQLSSLLGDQTPPTLLGLLLSGSTFSECLTYLNRNESINQGIKRKRHDIHELTSNEIKLDNGAVIILKGRVFPQLATKEFYSVYQGVPNLYISWKHNLKKCVDSSPLGVILTRSREELIIVASHSGAVVVTDVATGAIISQVTLPDRVESSACLSSDTNSFYIGCYDGCVYCIDLRLGTVIWKFHTSDIVKSTCVLHQGKLYFGSYNKQIYCINEDGSLSWETHIGSSVLSEILIDEIGIFVCGTVGGVWSLDFAGNIKWSVETKPIFTNPIISNGELVVAPVLGGVHFFNLTTGEKIRVIDIKGHVFSSPVLSKHLALLIIADSTLFVIKKEEVDSIELDSRTVSSPCFLDDGQNMVIVPSTNGKINLVSLKDKCSKVIYDLNNDVFSTPVIFPSRHIILGSRDNHVYSFKLAK